MLINILQLWNFQISKLYNLLIRLCNNHLSKIAQLYKSILTSKYTKQLSKDELELINSISAGSEKDFEFYCIKTLIKMT